MYKLGQIRAVLCNTGPMGNPYYKFLLILQETSIGSFLLSIHFFSGTNLSRDCILPLPQSTCVPTPFSSPGPPCAQRSTHSITPALNCVANAKLTTFRHYFCKQTLYLFSTKRTITQTSRFNVAFQSNSNKIDLLSYIFMSANKVFAASCCYPPSSLLSCLTTSMLADCVLFTTIAMFSFGHFFYF